MNKTLKTGIHPQAYISAKATIGKDCYIGAFVSIDDNAVIGDGTHIYANCVIGEKDKKHAPFSLEKKYFDLNAKWIGE